MTTTIRERLEENGITLPTVEGVRGIRLQQAAAQVAARGTARMAQAPRAQAPPEAGGQPERPVDPRDRGPGHREVPTMEEIYRNNPVITFDPGIMTTGIVGMPGPAARLRVDPREPRAIEWRTGGGGYKRQQEKVSGIVGLGKKGEGLLTTKEGRAEFEKVFGRDVIEKRYRVGKEASARVSNLKLGERLRRLMTRGVSPRMLLELVGTVSDPERLERALGVAYGADGERGRATMIKVPSTVSDMQGDWHTYMKWDGNDKRPAMGGNKKGWVAAVWRKVTPEYRDAIRSIIGSWDSNGADVWARLPKAEVVRIVGLWLKGEVWVARFNGRDELDRRILSWAYLRVKYLPEFPAGDIRGIVDVSELLKSNEAYREGHIQQGYNTTETGYFNLMQLCKRRRKDGLTMVAMKRKVAAMLEDEEELAGRGIELRSERARQVVVFRMARGVVLWMDKTKRIVQIGPSPDMFSWRLGELSSEFPITIIAASTLGYPEGVWGWSTIIRGLTLAMVVPDVHWDAMVGLWNTGYIMWPQLIEAGGMPGYVKSLPAWNGSIGNHCFGGADLSGYSMGGIQGTSESIGLTRGSGGQGQRFWEQPRIACMMQDGSFSWEAMKDGAIRVYVPVHKFLGRIAKLKAHLKKEVWGKGLPIDLEFGVVTQSVRQTMQMICQYGQKSVSWWQHPVCGTRSRVWWWGRTDLGGFNPESIEGYPSLGEMVRRMELRNMLGPKVWNPSTLQEHDDKGWSCRKGLGPREVWEMAYLPLKIAVDSNLNLVWWKDATDKGKKGLPWGKGLKWKIPPRVVGTTPDTTKETKAAEELGWDLATKGNPPACGMMECTRPECNGEGGINRAQQSGMAKPAWKNVPSGYIKWTKPGDKKKSK